MHNTSNRFVLHVILSSIVLNLEDENQDFSKYLEQTLDLDIKRIEKKLFNLVEKKYKSSLIHQVFRNYTKCRDLQNLILK